MEGLAGLLERTKVSLCEVSCPLCSWYYYIGFGEPLFDIMEGIATHYDECHGMTAFKDWLDLVEGNA